MKSKIEFLIQGTLQKMELLANKHNMVLWAADETYSQSYYVSSNYPSIWKRDIVDIYSSLKIWGSYLAENKNDKVLKVLNTRDTPVNPNHTECYGFYLPDGEIQWCIDRCFHLNNFKNECVLVAGAALPVSQNQLSSKYKNNLSDLLDKVIIEYYYLLTQSENAAHYNYTSSFIKALSQITKREKEVFEWLLHGLTSKQIAKRLKISIRTVETHINKLKNKFNAGSKSELISIAIKNNCIDVVFPSRYISIA